METVHTQILCIYLLLENCVCACLLFGVCLLHIVVRKILVLLFFLIMGTNFLHYCQKLQHRVTQYLLYSTSHCLLIMAELMVEDSLYSQVGGKFYHEALSNIFNYHCQFISYIGAVLCKVNYCGLNFYHNSRNISRTEDQ